MLVRTPTRNMSSKTEKSRSPAATQTEEAGPSAISRTRVRRSIGEIESRYKTPTPPKKGILPAKNLPQKSAEPPKTTETTKYLNRTSEGKALLAKAKYHIGSSRNTKTEIKTVVIEVVERMYRMIKELEAELKGNKQQPREQGSEERKESNKEEISSALIEKIEEHSKLLQECKEETGKLKEELKAVNEKRLSYAAVTSKSPNKQPPSQNTLHSVIITSTNELDTCDEMLQKIRKAVDAKAEGIQIDRVRKAKDQKIIVGCKTKEELGRVKERIKKAERDLTFEEMKNKNPLVKLRDVLNFNTDEDILEALKSQNRQIFNGLEEEQAKIEVRYRIRTRNPHVSHVVLRVAPKLWHILMEMGKIHIDLQRIRVEDQSPIIQCTKCLGYGHGKKFCNEEVEKCSHCGGSHLRIDCPTWRDGHDPICCNCKREGLLSTEHNAFSNECPVRKRWDRIARSSIAYC